MKPPHFLLRLCHLQTVFWQKKLFKSYFVHFFAEAVPGSRQGVVTSWPWAQQGQGAGWSWGTGGDPRGERRMLCAPQFVPARGALHWGVWSRQWQNGPAPLLLAQLPSAWWDVFPCAGQGRELLAWEGADAAGVRWGAWSPPSSQNGLLTSSGEGAVAEGAAVALRGSCGQLCSWGSPAGTSLASISTQMAMLESSSAVCWAGSCPWSQNLQYRGSHTGISLLCFSQSPIFHHSGTYGISAVPSVSSDPGISSHRILIPLNVKSGKNTETWSCNWTWIEGYLSIIPPRAFFLLKKHVVDSLIMFLHSHS